MSHKRKFNDLLDAFKKKLSAFRTDRPSVGMFFDIPVEVSHGGIVPLHALASVTVRDGRTVVVAVHDRGTLHRVEKALRMASHNPSIHDTSLYVVMPPLSEERREDICKTIRTLAEDFKIVARSIRRDWLDAGGTTKEVEAETKSVIQKIDQLIKAKQSEVMG